ncbi:MAG: hypothetical protein VKK59_02040 [Vampirovibrionales bacterium]|nr:hypothetical protein [Vampirovibrionales bacterium]
MIRSVQQARTVSFGGNDEKRKRPIGSRVFDWLEKNGLSQQLPSDPTERAKVVGEIAEESQRRANDLGRHLFSGDSRKLGNVFA